MPGDIFYSQVSIQVQNELKARGQAGLKDRSTKALDFMLGKVANVELIAYRSSNIVTGNEAGTLGGSTVRGGSYLPSSENILKGVGYVEGDPRPSRNFNRNGGFLTDLKSNNKQSYRVPPYVSSATITIGDEALGVLNKATISTIIPDPTRDLDDMERIWFRPGRHVKVKIEYPKSAVLSTTTNEEIEEDLQQFGIVNPGSDDKRKGTITSPPLNKVEFIGVITSFEYNYQTNGTIEGTLSLTGTSNTYTDISMLMANEGGITYDELDTKKKTDGIDDVKQDFVEIEQNSTPPIPGENEFLGINPGESVFFGSNAIDASTTTMGGLGFGPSELEKEFSDYNPTEDTKTTILTINTFYQTFEKDYNSFANNKTTNHDTADGSFEDEIEDHTLQYAGAKNFPNWFYKDSVYGSAEFKRYTTLAYLINFINFYIMKKAKSDNNNPYIICTDKDNFCQSNYYENIVSANPLRILLQGKGGAGKTNQYGIVNGKDFYIGDSRDIGGAKNWPGYQSKDANGRGRAYPSRIWISLEVIKELSEALTPNEKQSSFRIKDFLAKISEEINKQTAGAINLKLITHPAYPDLLLFYDANFIGLDTHDVTPFEIPMWANNANGTIVRDFKLNCKIPDSVKSLAYVLNQGPDEIADEDIAPYLNFMYAENDETRDKLKERYEGQYNKYKALLDVAKQEYGLNPSSEEKIKALRIALRKHLQYPTKKIDTSNSINAPMFTYSAEFTVDGIHGFRYGDVLQFPGIPKRYKDHTIFNILQIVHTINSSGTWTTKVTCIMRPKIPDSPKGNITI